MEFFVKFMFWLHLVGFVAGLITLNFYEYPRKREFSVGFDAAQAIFMLAMTLWAGFLAFGPNLLSDFGPK